jgi:hypothetical protein
MLKASLLPRFKRRLLKAIKLVWQTETLRAATLHREQCMPAETFHWAGVVNRQAACQEAQEI